MRAVPFFSHGSADVLEYRNDFPDPAARSGQAVLDVEYCGVNHLDIWTRQGIPGKKISLPHICGCDIVGRTKSKGRVMVYPGISCGSCNRCRAGRENLCNDFAIIGGMSDHDGGYAERVSVPAKNIIKLPSSIKPELAATLAVSYLTAWNMLTTNLAGPGKTVLIYGAASGVGMATIQLAKALGSTVITTVSSEAKRDFAEKLGADFVIDRSTENIAESAAKFAKGGVDIVVDHVGASTWGTSIAALKPGGRMAVCGMTSGNEATVPIRMFYIKQIVMTGALLGTKRQLHELLNFVSRKKIRPVVDSVMPLQEAAQAHKKMEQGRHMGKILLKCN
jgi:NADPH:quinone reductase-like Zn-dependent oxidoreductase